MKNQHVHPIFRDILNAFAAPRAPDGLTGEALAAWLRNQGFDARVAQPLEPEQPEVAPVTAPEDMEAADCRCSRGDHRTDRDLDMDDAGVARELR